MNRELAEKLRDISVAKFEKIQEFIEYDDLELAALETAMSENCGYCQEFSNFHDNDRQMARECGDCPVLNLPDKYFVYSGRNAPVCIALKVFDDLTDALNADEQMASSQAVVSVIEFIKGPLFEESLKEKNAN